MKSDRKESQLFIFFHRRSIKTKPFSTKQRGKILETQKIISKNLELSSSSFRMNYYNFLYDSLWTFCMCVCVLWLVWCLWNVRGCIFFLGGREGIWNCTFGDQEIAREERYMAHLCTGVISLICNFQSCAGRDPLPTTLRWDSFSEALGSQRRDTLYVFNY